MLKKDMSSIDAKSFSNLLSNTTLSNYLSLVNFLLKFTKGVGSNIQYNRKGLDLLKNKHEYTFPIIEGDLQLSIQLYRNSNNHYRLFCFTHIKGKSGLTFSVNLTTEKESENIIYLTQKIKFSEQYKGNNTIAQSFRRQKQIIFCNLLTKLGFDVTENNDLILGIFDPKQKRFINTSSEKFLNDFIVVSLLKGHFQGNKGYQLEILPNYNIIENQYKSNEVEIKNIPLKLIKNKHKRHIPLSLRYKILQRDHFKCMKCGFGVDDGVKLHIDHKIPYSLGGLTELNNLHTLCIDCNLGKSNNYID